MTKLRISDHKLMVEKGRHFNPIIPRENRKCHMCTTEVENEVHFLTDCKMYGSQSNFWNQVTTKFPQTANLRKEDKLTFILTQEDPEILELLLKSNYEWQRLNNFLCKYFYEKTDQTINISQGSLPSLLANLCFLMVLILSKILKILVLAGFESYMDKLKR